MDIYHTISIDGAVRRASAGNKQNAAVFDSIAVCRASAPNIQIACVSDSIAVCRSVFHDIHGAVDFLSRHCHRGGKQGIVRTEVNSFILAGISYNCSILCGNFSNTRSPVDIQRRSAAVDLQRTSGIECNAVRLTPSVDKHIAVSIDYGAVRRASAVDIQCAPVTDRDSIRRGSGMNSRIVADFQTADGIGLECHLGSVFHAHTAAVFHDFCRSTFIGDIHTAVCIYNSAVRRPSAGNIQRAPVTDNGIGNNAAAVNLHPVLLHAIQSFTGHDIGRGHQQIIHVGFHFGTLRSQVGNIEYDGGNCIQSVIVAAVVVSSVPFHAAAGMIGVVKNNFLRGGIIAVCNDHVPVVAGFHAQEDGPSGVDLRLEIFERKILYFDRPGCRCIQLEPPFDGIQIQSILEVEVFRRNGV